MSQQKRKQLEEPFGWGKTIGPMAKTMLRSLEHVGAQCAFAMAGFNLSKLPRLIPA